MLTLVIEDLTQNRNINFGLIPKRFSRDSNRTVSTEGCLFLCFSTSTRFQLNMTFNLFPARIIDHDLVLPTMMVVILHFVVAASALSPGSAGSSSVESLAMEDFQHLTDKLTHKLMKDIGKLKADDPNWPGKPPARMSQEDVTEEQMKAMSECEFHCPKGNFGNFLKLIYYLLSVPLLYIV